MAQSITDSVENNLAQSIESELNQIIDDIGLLGELKDRDSLLRYNFILP
jgi:hypothetical protein